MTNDDRSSPLALSSFACRAVAQRRREHSGFSRHSSFVLRHFSAFVLRHFHRHLNPLKSSSAFVFVASRFSISFSIASIGGSAAMVLRRFCTRSHSSG